MREAIETRTGRIDRTANSDRRRIGEAVVIIAVEQLAAAPTKRQADAIAGLGMLVETGDEHHIAAGAAVGNPAMHDDDAIEIMDPADPHAFRAQRRLVPAQRNKVLREAQIIGHDRVSLEAVPPDWVARVILFIVVPELVFEDFLA